eukprot:4717057-Pyramimonas_sp.AAC.1
MGDGSHRAPGFKSVLTFAGVRAMAKQRLRCKAGEAGARGTGSWAIRASLSHLSGTGLGGGGSES